MHHTHDTTASKRAWFMKVAIKRNELMLFIVRRAPSQRDSIDATCKLSIPGSSAGFHCIQCAALVYATLNPIHLSCLKYRRRRNASGISDVLKFRLPSKEQQQNVRCTLELTSREVKFTSKFEVKNWRQKLFRPILGTHIGKIKKISWLACCMAIMV